MQQLRHQVVAHEREAEAATAALERARATADAHARREADARAALQEAEGLCALLRGERPVPDAPGLPIAELEALHASAARGVEALREALHERLLDQARCAHAVRKCVVCEDRVIDTVLMPCRHHQLCSGCAEQVGTCPLCRVRIEDRILTFGR